jgi:MFS family permease
MLGIVPTWGNIVVYITSYFRLYNPGLLLSQTFLVFPMTLSMGALSMQFGSLLLDILHPKVHLLLGGSIFVLSILVSSYMTDFYYFLLFYAVLTGVGYGLVYFLPLKSAWSFFPTKKGTIGGLILASHSFGAIGWSFYTATSINPLNEAPTLNINVGNTQEILFSAESGPVKNVAGTLQKVFFVELALFLIALIMMQKKKVVQFDKELAEKLIEDDVGEARKKA